ncbi:hypothetical protein OS493_028698 [Desmophyllum pertusum]|uniref:Uncharacterized protein n=1 Tax=Desmophyllum pertusum TaxID=174260 RepID=A0A9W9YKB8_9CNID|nr:hypothetical protein OS493_028698 [Desmophyllum pertusum]
MEGKHHLHTLLQRCTKNGRGDGVKVFYLRGNHDHEMTAEAVEQLMERSDDAASRIEYFLRMGMTGIYSPYSLTEPNDPLGGRPIGYYVKRAVATTERQL